MRDFDAIYGPAQMIYSNTVLAQFFRMSLKDNLGLKLGGMLIVFATSMTTAAAVRPIVEKILKMRGTVFLLQ